MVDENENHQGGHCQGAQESADPGTAPDDGFTTRKLALLNRISNAVLQESPIEEVMDQALEGVCTLLGTPRATVRLFGTVENIFEHRILGFPSVGDLLPSIACPRTGKKLYADGQPMLVWNVRECIPYRGRPEALESVRMGAFLGVPMIAREDFLGVLFIDRPEPHRWQNWEVSAAESVARQIAIAIRHANFFRDHEELSGKLVALLNNMPGTVYHADQDGRFSLVGDTILGISGRPAQEFLDGDIRWADLVLSEDQARVTQELSDAVRLHLRSFRIEYRVRHRDDGIRWVADRHQLSYDAAGKPSGMDGLLLDITDRKQAESETARTGRALRESEERYALALRGSNDGIWDWNVHTGEVYFSPRMKEMLGYGADEIANQIDEWTSRIHPDDFDHVIATLHDHLAKKTPTFEVEYRLKHKDGGYRWILARSVCLEDPGGEPYRIAGSHTDLTGHRQLEGDLLHAQKMDAVGQLASGIAHDFNNMLTAIRGYAYLLMLRSEKHPESQREIEEIIKASDRAASLTQQLLAFSRKQVLQMVVTDMNAIVAGMEPMLRRLIGENIDLVSILKPGLSQVRVDRGQFEQVIMNLVVNARDAMPENGGMLLVETDDLPTGDVVIQVTDNGHGMDDETLARTFEPFFTTKEPGKGTGLGLSTVYGIVKQSGGDITVKSRPGTGTTFRIVLPALRGERPETGREETRNASPGGRETLLLVEDEEVVRRLVAEILQEAGYTVLQAEDGEKAMALAGKHAGPIHLLLTDVVMPRMGGRALAGAVSGLLPETLVLYMSGYTTEAAIRDGVAQDGIAFLQKPFTPDSLVRKVRDVLDRRNQGGAP